MYTIEQIKSGQLIGTKQIKLSCGLEQFPQELFQYADSLEILDLSFNKLNSLPNDFYRFQKLKILFCSDNLFTEFPEVLGQCLSLEMIGFKSNQIVSIPENSLPKQTRWLILTNNKIEKLPTCIGKCSRLQKVALAGNRIKVLPDEMAQCKNLELLRISSNQLESIPDWLLTLPKLAWLAFSANKFNAKHKIPKPLQELNWRDFTIHEKLGEGASGIIYKAIWNNLENKKEVAIKVFKGDVTSDGLPEDEMQACITAGEHPNLYGLLGSIVNHPQQKIGLVMNLIPSTYKNLGLPPSFETCSRDTFSEGTMFTINQIHCIVLQVANVSAQLHSNGLMHGDLYAHNCLVDTTNHCYLGDFGATTFYDQKLLNATNIQKIEVRAFACLLDDLLINVQSDDLKSSIYTMLSKLRDECMKTNVSQRLSFVEIIQILESVTI